MVPAQLVTLTVSAMDLGAAAMLLAVERNVYLCVMKVLPLIKASR